MKKIDYVFPKWEKRKGKLLGYENMIVLRINNIKKATEQGGKIGINDLYLLALSYVDLLMIDYIQQRNEDFEKHMHDLLGYMKECIIVFGEGEDIPEATRRSIIAEQQAGYWGYYALSVLDFDILKYLVNPDSSLMKMMEKKVSIAESANLVEIFDMQNAIIERDPVKFNLALQARIQSIRKMPADYVLCLDIWSFALIRYAEHCGMQVDRNRYVEADLDHVHF